MNPRLAGWLTRLYPRRWRERYGAEFEAFLVDGSAENHAGLRVHILTTANIVRSAICEHIFPTRGGNMELEPRSFSAVLKQPSAFLPLAMSIMALAMVLGTLAMYGVVHEADEGTVAHLWQILMAGQAPVIAFFAIKWLRRAPKQALGVLALQAVAVLASMAPVFFLNL
jgi:hypothetical protein